jgi:phosphohistidine phosphatase
MGERIQTAGIRPSLILSSTAVRAWKTAKGVAKEISYPNEFLQREQRLYHAGVNRILDVLAQQDDAFNSIMIVGHNNIPTCGFVSVTIDTEDWNLKGEKKVELAAYDYPKKKH